MDYGPYIIEVKHSTWSKAIDIDPTSRPSIVEHRGQITGQPNVYAID